MDISQQAGSKRKSVSEIKNYLMGSFEPHISMCDSAQFPIVKNSKNTTAAYSSLLRCVKFDEGLFLDL